MSKIYFLAIVLIILCGIAGIMWSNNNEKTQSPVACTMEAKICPDGSAVGRTGPQCEFTPCPTGTTSQVVPTSGDVTIGVGEKKSIGDLSITLNNIVGDSRCPQDVQCVWAGELKVSVTLATASKSETRDMTFGKGSFVFEGHTVTMTNAPAALSSNVKVGKDYYRIGFNVVVNQTGAVGL